MRKELKKIEQEKVDEWNARNKVGQRVVLTKDDGRKIGMKTIGKAELLNGHTAIVPLSGRSVCYLVERTKAVNLFSLWCEKAVARLKRFAEKIERLSETEFGILDGDHCNRRFCPGIIEIEEGSCCCSVVSHPPCSYCENSGVWCPECGWES